MTEKLYYVDSYLREFEAVVLACKPEGRRHAVVLDKTAFFPEGGGQAADPGFLNDVAVLDVQESGGEIVHYTAQPLSVGEPVTGRLDWAVRFSRMQGHSGEHIVSGIAHRLYGCTNVGFHLGDDAITIDYDVELTAEQVRALELEANRVVWENRPITAEFPEPALLPSLEYRSKLELTENVRIVTIADCDVCACCAPHVAFTGAVGSIRLIDVMRHRGGVRITMLAGPQALQEAVQNGASVTAISTVLSAPRESVASAVDRLLEKQTAYEDTIYHLQHGYIAARAALVPKGTRCCCVFDTLLDRNALRDLVNAITAVTGSLCAAFSGDDRKGYGYIIAQPGGSLNVEVRAINAALGGKGGGKPEMVQGSVTATREAILAYFAPDCIL